MRSNLVLTLAGLALVCSSTSGAQPLGLFAWQLQPYCNRVVVNIVQAGGVYTVDGWDDQCGGASPHAPLVGIASLNPDGTIGLGLNIVTAPGGAPVHVDAIVTLPTASGTWRDSSGGSGVFALGAATGGSPRPAGGIGASAIDTTQIQRRVSGECSAGQSMTGVNQDGTVACQAAGGGDVTGVMAGAGLTGGGPAGDIALAVSFAGSGAASTVARSDHTHAVGAANTAVGTQALGALTSGSGNTAAGTGALSRNTSGSSNTAAGTYALLSNTTGLDNTGIGRNALNINTSGNDNTAAGAYAMALSTTGSENAAFGSEVLVYGGSWNVGVGHQALKGGGSRSVAVGHRALVASTVSATDNVAIGSLALAKTVGGPPLTFEGSSNTAIGSGALTNNTSGDRNTAVGSGVLGDLTSGQRNIAIGVAGTGSAGRSLVTGSDNIYVGASAGSSSEAGTMRLGSAISRTFIDGIRAVATEVNNAVPVLIDSRGQLGTASSSRRTKESIVSLGTDTTFKVQSLRPVQFQYRKAFADGTKPVQYGLIAEEVEEVLPELVAYNGQGEVETVKYHILPTLLLAEIQRLERERAAHEARLVALEHRIERLMTASRRR